MVRSTQCISLRRIMYKFLFVVLLCVLIAAQKTELDSPENVNIFRTFRKWVFHNLGIKVRDLDPVRGITLKEFEYLKESFVNHMIKHCCSGGDQLHRPTAMNLLRLQKQLPPDVPFPCNVTGSRSPKVPDSVHRLRPGDIDVIAAIGDSVTAGAGIFASNMIQIFIENRGATGSIGGQGNWRTYLTLPNILKEFNPTLIGYSLGDSFTSDPDSQFNVAETGAMARDMPFMARYLVDRMKQDSRVNIKEHWKLISILIGHNDFCVEICNSPSPTFILETYKNDLIDTLRILRDNLPRTFVVVPMMFSLEAYTNGMKTVPILTCYIITRTLCPCLFGLHYQDRIPEYYEVMKRWMEVQEEVVSYPEFNTENFTVVSSPVLQNFTIPLTEDKQSDLTYFSVDCFHPTQKLNARYANALWNSLLEPVGNKSRLFQPEYERFLCPTPEKPFLMTRENSQEGWDK